MTVGEGILISSFKSKGAFTSWKLLFHVIKHKKEFVINLRTIKFDSIFAILK